MKRLLARVWCWWFGCDPVTVFEGYEVDEFRWHCGRCDCVDVSYSDLIGDTRHRRFVRWLTAHGSGRWLRPTPKCKDCGLSEDRCDCVPF